MERNKQDNRDRSWKIQGSKTEWDALSNKVKGKLEREEWIALVEELKTNHSYDCIEDINDKKQSHGLSQERIIFLELL